MFTERTLKKIQMEVESSVYGMIGEIDTRISSNDKINIAKYTKTTGLEITLNELVDVMKIRKDSRQFGVEIDEVKSFHRNGNAYIKVTGKIVDEKLLKDQEVLMSNAIYSILEESDKAVRSGHPFVFTVKEEFSPEELEWLKHSGLFMCKRADDWLFVIDGIPDLGIWEYHDKATDEDKYPCYRRRFGDILTRRVCQFFGQWARMSNILTGKNPGSAIRGITKSKNDIENEIARYVSENYAYYKTGGQVFTSK